MSDDAKTRENAAVEGVSVYHGPDKRFRPGNPGGPGRPKGTGKIQVLATCRRCAKDEGLDLDQLIWGMMKGLIQCGSEGNAKAARVVLDHLAVAVEKAMPEINVDIDARSVSLNTGEGATLPPTSDEASAYLQKVVELSHTIREQTQARNGVQQRGVDLIDDMLS